MENREILKQKLRSVLWAAISGALLPIVLMRAVYLGYDLWGRGGYHGKPSTDFWLGLALLMNVPSGFLMKFVGFFVNPYLVNALLGSAFLGSCAAAWKFLMKGHDEN